MTVAIAQADLFGQDKKLRTPKVKRSSEVESFPGGEIEYRPYQVECVDANIEALDQGVYRQVNSLATGAGKTIMIGLLIKRLRERALAEGCSPGKVLVIAHRTELVESNAEKIKWVNPELSVQIEQADLKSNADADVISASIATIGRSGSDRIKKFNPEDFMAVVIDEAHHAAGSTYKRVLIEHFKTDDPNTHIMTSGWSATIRRNDGKGLDDLFDEIVYHKGIQDFIEEGWLTRLRGVRVGTDTNLNEVTTLAGDFNQGQLENAVNTPARNAVLYNAWKKHSLDAGRKSTLVFCVDKAHARAVQETFGVNGVSAGLILGDTDRDERKNTLKMFSKREIPVLINVGVMTEGTDVPCIDTILMARPTQSSPLYIQIIGRGLRLFGGKEDCVVIDVVDICQSHSLMTVPVLFGLNQDFDPEGEDIVRVSNRIQEMAEENGGVLSAKSMQEAEKIQSEDFDPFSTMQPPEDIQEMSELKWYMTGENKYRADIKGGDAKRGNIEVKLDEIGHWEITHNKPNGIETTIRRRNDVDIAFQAADKYIKEQFPESIALMSKQQDWHKNAPSAAQINLLKRIGKWLPEGVPENLTKGTASDAIDKCFKIMNAAKKGNRKATPPKRVDAVKVGKI